jgi:hypothetical protein
MSRRHEVPVSVDDAPNVVSGPWLGDAGALVAPVLPSLAGPTMTRERGRCHDCRPLPGGGLEFCAVHADELEPLAEAGIRIVAFMLGCAGTVVLLLVLWLAR